MQISFYRAIPYLILKLSISQADKRLCAPVLYQNASRQPHFSFISPFTSFTQASGEGSLPSHGYNACTKQIASLFFLRTGEHLTDRHGHNHISCCRSRLNRSNGYSDSPTSTLVGQHSTARLNMMRASSSSSSSTAAFHSRTELGMCSSAVTTRRDLTSREHLPHPPTQQWLFTEYRISSTQDKTNAFQLKA